MTLGRRLPFVTVLVRLNHFARNGFLDTAASDEVFEALKKAAFALRPEDSLAIDASGVDAVTPSAVERSLVLLLLWAREGVLGPWPIALTNGHPRVLEVIDGVLSNYSLALLARDHDGAAAVLGGSAVIGDDARLADKLREFTVREFAAAVGMTKQGVEHRLRNLERAGILVRSHHGRTRTARFRLAVESTSAALAS